MLLADEDELGPGCSLQEPIRPRASEPAVLQSELTRVSPKPVCEVGRLGLSGDQPADGQTRDHQAGPEEPRLHGRWVLHGWNIVSRRGREDYFARGCSLGTTVNKLTIGGGEPPRGTRSHASKLWRLGAFFRRRPQALVGQCGHRRRRHRCRHSGAVNRLIADHNPTIDHSGTPKEPVLRAAGPPARLTRV